MARPHAGWGEHTSQPGHADVVAVGSWPEPTGEVGGTFLELCSSPKVSDVLLISILQKWYRLVVTDSNIEECALLKSHQLVAVAPSKYF